MKLMVLVHSNINIHIWVPLLPEAMLHRLPNLALEDLSIEILEIDFILEVVSDDLLLKILVDSVQGIILYPDFLTEVRFVKDINLKKHGLYGFKAVYVQITKINTSIFDFGKSVDVL